MSKRLFTTIGFVLLLVGVLNAQGLGLRQFQYWIDEDFEGRGTSSSETLAINIADLTSGAHFLSVMRYADDGTSSCYRYAFFKKYSEIGSGAVIQSSEYWIDDDYEGRISFDSETFAIDISRLEVGAHFLSVMCYASDGTGSCYRYAFYKKNMEKETPEDAQYCYWIDDDYESRITTAKEDVMIDVSNLAKGVHFFNAMQNAKDGTSSCYRKLFYLAENNDLELVEAWIDDDYSSWRQTAKAKDGKAKFSIDIAELENGKHWFNFMSRSSSGNWNAEDILQFVKRELVPLAEGEWAAIVALHDALVKRGWKTPWDISLGEDAVNTFDGLQVSCGHVTGLDISGNGFEGAVPEEFFAFGKMEWLDISGNRFTGNLGLLAQKFPELASLDASSNCFEAVSPMISPNVKKLYIGNQTIDKKVALNISKPDLEKFFEDVPSVLLYDHAGQTYSAAIELLATTDELPTLNIGDVKDWAVRLDASASQVRGRDVSAPMVYRGKSGDSVLAYDMVNKNKLKGSRFGLEMSFEKGDANFGGGVDASDLQATILYLFDNYRYQPFNFTAADTYEDGDINVQDVVCTVNILLADAAPQSRRKAPAAGEEQEAPAACVFVRNGQVVLRSEVAVAALNVSMSGQANWDIARYGMMQSTNGGNLVGYSLSGATLPAGETVIGTCAEGTAIRSVSAADAEAQPIAISIGDCVTTGIAAVAGDNADGGIIYDAAGMRQSKPMGGINIIRNGGGTVKVTIKQNK